MENLKDIMSDVRIFLYGGVRTLPLTIAGVMLILGLMTANYAILFFLVGFLIAAPLGAEIMNLIVDFATTGSPMFKVAPNDLCDLRIPFSMNATNASTTKYVTMFSSTWIAMTAFFFGYMLTNAIELFKRPVMSSSISVNSSVAPDVSGKASNRRTQALISIASIIVAAIVILAYRIFFSGCDSKVGGVITTLLFGTLGWGWYGALSKTGEDRLSDLFGIANRLLPPGAIANGPIACVPIRK